MRRVHAYPDEASALDAIEAIDTARPATEAATTYLGARSTERAIASGYARRDRSGALAVTPEGAAEGYAIEGARLVRQHSIPARKWADPIPLADGTYAVPVCAEVEGRQPTIRGKRRPIPRDATARTITAADRRRDDGLEELPVDVPPIGGGKGRTP